MRAHRARARALSIGFSVKWDTLKFSRYMPLLKGISLYLPRAPEGCDGGLYGGSSGLVKRWLIVHGLVSTPKPCIAGTTFADHRQHLSTRSSRTMGTAPQLAEIATSRA